MLKPDLAILDETDSGLDVDAVHIVSKGVEEYKKQVGGALMIITHSTRILEALNIDTFRKFRPLHPPRPLAYALGGRASTVHYTFAFLLMPSATRIHLSASARFRSSLQSRARFSPESAAGSGSRI